jgi:hypothetical protein
VWTRQILCECVAHFSDSPDSCFKGVRNSFLGYTEHIPIIFSSSCFPLTTKNVTKPAALSLLRCHTVSTMLMGYFRTWHHHYHHVGVWKSSKKQVVCFCAQDMALQLHAEVFYQYICRLGLVCNRNLLYRFLCISFIAFLSPGDFFELLMKRTSGQCCVGVM